MTRFKQSNAGGKCLFALLFVLLGACVAAVSVFFAGRWSVSVW